MERAPVDVMAVVLGEVGPRAAVDHPIDGLGRRPSVHHLVDRLLHDW